MKPLKNYDSVDVKSMTDAELEAMQAWEDELHEQEIRAIEQSLIKAFTQIMAECDNSGIINDIAKCKDTETAAYKRAVEKVHVIVRKYFNKSWEGAEYVTGLLCAYYHEYKGSKEKLNNLPGQMTAHFIAAADTAYRLCGADNPYNAKETAEELDGQMSLYDVSKPERILYDHIISTSLTNLIKITMNNPQNVETARKGQVKTRRPKEEENGISGETVIYYKSNDAEYKLTLERSRELFNKHIPNGAKFFNFLLEKNNSQNREEITKWNLNELVDRGIYKNIDSAYIGQKNILKKMERIFIEGVVIDKRKKKEEQERFWHSTALAYAPKTSYTACKVILPEIIRKAAPQIMILPKWAYMLNDTAYTLLDYIYYLARQNTGKIKQRGYFTISLNSIRAHLGLPTPDEVKTKHKRDYNRYIINPIDNAITAIEDARTERGGKDIMIDIVYNFDYKNIHEYLEGYLQIAVSGDTLEYMNARAADERKAKAAHKRIAAKSTAS